MCVFICINQTVKQPLPNSDQFIWYRFFVFVDVSVGGCFVYFYFLHYPKYIYDVLTILTNSINSQRFGLDGHCGLK